MNNSTRWGIDILISCAKSNEFCCQKNEFFTKKFVKPSNLHRWNSFPKLRLGIFALLLLSKLSKTPKIGRRLPLAGIFPLFSDVFGRRVFHPLLSDFRFYAFITHKVWFYLLFRWGGREREVFPVSPVVSPLVYFFFSKEFNKTVFWDDRYFANFFAWLNFVSLFFCKEA